MNKLLTLLLLCITMPAIAQIDFEQGYFINNQGNKTACLIRNVAWKNNPTTFDYKLTEGAAAQIATIKEVTEFSVSGYKFIKYTVDIDRSAKDMGNLSIKREPEFKQETLFLKVVIEGLATLYQYEDGNLVRYFYSKGADVSRQLIYKEYQVDENVAYNYQFRGQLYTLMADRITDNSRFKNIRYEKSALVKVFVEYNGGEGEVSKNLSESQNKTSVNFKITPGVNFGNVVAEQTSFSMTNAVSLDTKATFRIGIEAEVILPFNNNKWSLFTDPNYYKYSSSGASENYRAKQEWTIDYSCIEIPLGVRHYLFLGKTSKLFIDAAYVLAITSSKNKLNFNYTSMYSTYSLDADLQKSSNLALGIGFSHDRYSIEARYGLKRQLLGNYAAWMAEYSSVGIILGYKVF